MHTNERFTRANNSQDAESRDLLKNKNKHGQQYVDALTAYGERFESILASAVRHILRTYNVDMIPHVVGFLWSGTNNEYGHNMIVEVQYAKRGYRAVYGGKLTKTGFVWQCYMD